MGLIRLYACCSRISHQYQLPRTIPSEHNLKMPTVCECSRQEKQLIFNVINFHDSEKSGWKTHWYNVNERLTAMFGISMRLFERLKGRFWEDQKRLAEQIKRVNEEKLKKRKEQHEITLRLRHPSYSRAERRFSPMGTGVEKAILVGRAPLKTAHSSRLSILLSEQQ